MMGNCDMGWSVVVGSQFMSALTQRYQRWHSTRPDALGHQRVLQKSRLHPCAEPVVLLYLEQDRRL